MPQPTTPTTPITFEAPTAAAMHQLGIRIAAQAHGGDVILLSADPDAQDRAVVLLKYNNKTTAFAIEGYQVMKNVAAAVSPEGFSEENPLA